MKHLPALVTAAALAAALVFAPPAAAAPCDTDVVPAATLLIPYFEVDLERPFDGATTLFSVSNVDAAPALAKVTLWTDWAVPSISFEVYLTGFDVQTYNLQDLLIFGNLPLTGSDTSPVGELSEPNAAFPDCNAASVGPQQLDETFVAELQALHTGEPSPLTGKCGGFPYGDSLARGYITIDVVNRCSSLNPSDAGYFAAGGTGVASDRNVLTGDYVYIDLSQASAQSEMAVHVEAFPGHFAPGDYTFYRRYVDGTAADDREPLGTFYSTRFLVGGAFSGGTTLAVWRDTNSANAAPIECATQINGDVPDRVPFAPLRAELIAFDEEENPEFAGIFDGCSGPGLGFDECSFDMPWATQAVELRTAVTDRSRHVFVPFEFGMLRVSLRNEDGFAASAEPLQGWVTAIMRAEGLYSVNTRALRLDSACAPGTEFPRPPP
jgi:hypothetical protein